ncbi:endoribonuclease CG2145-like [Diachasmimorpha longicaudata]|uniref:endoribonuclease CG2145-like n=1 Tax=Diachasmimorpha longicaudata TaxID=58733 RepID=UPI0030B8F180
MKSERLVIFVLTIVCCIYITAAKGKGGRRGGGHGGFFKRIFGSSSRTHSTNSHTPTHSQSYDSYGSTHSNGQSNGGSYSMNYGIGGLNSGHSYGSGNPLSFGSASRNYGTESSDQHLGSDGVSTPESIDVNDPPPDIFNNKDTGLVFRRHEHNDDLFPILDAEALSRWWNGEASNSEGLFKLVKIERPGPDLGWSRGVVQDINGAETHSEKTSTPVTPKSDSTLQSTDAPSPLRPSSLIGLPSTMTEDAGDHKPVHPPQLGQIGDSNSTPEIPVSPIEYDISEEELMNLTEALFTRKESTLKDYCIVNLQNQVTSENSTDQASGPLMYTSMDLYDLPTVRALHKMFNNYEINSTLTEPITTEQQNRENVLVDTFLKTTPMKDAMNWLASKDYFGPTEAEMLEVLRSIWFTKIEGTTSGFERIFLAEIYPDSNLLGGQNWIYFTYEESLKNINYMGYTEERNLTDKAKLLSVNFSMRDVTKNNSTMLIGTSPEFEMALYTICFYTRPDDFCPISLGGNKFHIYTHSFQDSGKDLIDIGVLVL